MYTALLMAVLTASAETSHELPRLLKSNNPRSGPMVPNQGPPVTNSAAPMPAPAPAVVYVPARPEPVAVQGAPVPTVTSETTGHSVPVRSETITIDGVVYKAIGVGPAIINGVPSSPLSPGTILLEGLVYAPVAVDNKAIAPISLTADDKAKLRAAGATEELIQQLIAAGLQSNQVDDYLSKQSAVNTRNGITDEDKKKLLAAGVSEQLLKQLIDAGIQSNQVDEYVARYKEKLAAEGGNANTKPASNLTEADKQKLKDAGLKEDFIAKLIDAGIQSNQVDEYLKAITAKPKSNLTEFDKKKLKDAGASDLFVQKLMDAGMQSEQVDAYISATKDKFKKADRK